MLSVSFLFKGVIFLFKGKPVWSWLVCCDSVPNKPIFFSELAICWSKSKYFWQYSKYSSRKLDNFVEIWHLVYFNTGLGWNFGHKNVFLGHWAQLFKENFGTRWLAIKLEGTQCCDAFWNFNLPVAPKKFFLNCFVNRETKSFFENLIVQWLFFLGLLA